MKEMSSHSSGVALGLGSQPNCSSPVPVASNSFPALHLPPARSHSLSLLSQEDFFQSFKGSFCDLRDALEAELMDCNYSIPDPQLVRGIISQVEFYLSDENLAKDAFLLKHVQKNKMGFVSIKLLTSFKKVKYLTRDWRLTLYALQFSKLLEVNKEGTKVRRRTPIPDSLLGIPHSKLLLAWPLLPHEQELLPLPQQSFLESIVRLFSPFGAISSIRLLRPGRKLPADVRRYSSRFPELLSRCCALLEYESLESARRAFQELGHQSCPAGESIRVVQLGGKGSKRKATAAEKEAEEEQVECFLAWKAPAAATTLPYGLGGSLLCSSPESDGAPASPLLLSEEPPAPTWPEGSFQPSEFSSAFSSSLFGSKLFPPLGAGVSSSSYSLCPGTESSGSSYSLCPGTESSGSSYSLCPGTESSGSRGLGSSSSSYSLCSVTQSSGSRGLGSRRGVWAPWSSNPPTPEASSLVSNPLAPKRVPESLRLQDRLTCLPRGPEGIKGFCSSFGRGELLLHP